MLEAFRVFGSVTVNTNSAANNLRELRNVGRTVVDALRSNFSGLTGAINGMIGTEVVSRVGALGKRMVAATSDMQGFKASLLAITHNGREAEMLFQKLNQFEIKTPYDLPEVIKAGIRFRVMGQEVEKNIVLAGELASAFNTDLNSAVIAVSKTMAGLPEGLESMRNTFGLTREELRKFGVGFDSAGQLMIKTKDDILILQKALTSYVQKTTGLVAMANYAKTLSGQFSNLSSEAFRTADVFGQDLAPSISYVTQAGIKALQMLRDMPPALKAVAIGAISVAGLAGGFSAIAPAIGPAIGLARALGSAIMFLATTAVTWNGVLTAGTGAIIWAEINFNKLLKVGKNFAGAAVVITAAWTMLLGPIHSSTLAVEEATAGQEALLVQAEAGRGVFSRYADQVGKTAKELVNLGVTSKDVSQDIIDLQAQRNTVGGKMSEKWGFGLFGGDQVVDIDKTQQAKISKQIADRKKVRDEIAKIEAGKGLSKAGRSSSQINEEIADIEHLAKVDGMTRAQQVKSLFKIRQEIAGVTELKKLDQQLEEKIRDIQKDNYGKLVNNLRNWRDYEEAQGKLGLQRKWDYINAEMNMTSDETEFGKEKLKELAIARKQVETEMLESSKQLARDTAKINVSATREKLIDLAKEIEDYRKAGYDKTKIDELEAKKRKQIWQDYYLERKQAALALEGEGIKTDLTKGSTKIADIEERKSRGADPGKINKELEKALKAQQANEVKDLTNEAEQSKLAISPIDPDRVGKKMSIQVQLEADIDQSKKELKRKIGELARETTEDQIKNQISNLEYQKAKAEFDKAELDHQIANGQAFKKNNYDQIQALRDQYDLEQKLLELKAKQELVDKTPAQQLMIEKQLQLDILNVQLKKITAVQDLKKAQATADADAAKKKAADKAAFYNTNVMGTLEDLNAKDKAETEAWKQKDIDNKAKRQAQIDENIRYNEMQRAAKAAKGATPQEVRDMRDKINKDQRDRIKNKKGGKEEAVAENVQKLEITIKAPDGSSETFGYDDTAAKADVKNYNVPPNKKGTMGG